MTGVHNNPNVGGVNGAQGTGAAGEVTGAEPTASDFGLNANFNSEGNAQFTAIPAGNTGGTKGPQLTAGERAAILNNIARNYSTAEQIAAASDNPDNGLGSAGDRAAAFASTLADFH